MRILRNTVLFALTAIAVAQPQKADWSKWWPQFQAAVAKHDARAVADMTYMPTQWELGKIRRVESKATFIAKFDTYFPEPMRQAVASKKPEAFPDGAYTITWVVKNDEYTLYFKEDGKGGFRVDALSEGPA